MKPRKLFVFATPIVVAFGAFATSSLSHAVDIVWGTNLGAGPWDWNTGANWTGGSAPVSSTDRGDLRKDWTAAATVNFSTPTILNGILFDDTGASGDVGVTINNGGTAANTVTLAGTTPVIQSSGSSLTISNVLAGTTAWTKSGAGTLVLNNSGNTITGAITVSGGVLQIRDGSTNTPTFLTAGALSGSTLTVQNGAILELPRLHATTATTTTWSVPTLSLQTGSTLRFRQSTGSNTNNLAANISNAGTTTIDSNGGSYVHDINLTGALSGSGTINYYASSASGSVTTTRTLTLNNAGTTFSGNWFVDYTATTTDDFVALRSSTAGALGTGAVTLDDRARLINNVNGGINSLSGVTLQKSTSFLDLAQRTWTNTAASLTLNAGTVTLGVTTTGGSASIGNLSGTGGSITTSGTVASSFTVNQTTDATFSGTLAPVTGSSLSFTKNGTARLTLNTASPFSGDVGLVVNDGKLALGNGSTTYANAFATSLSQTGGTLEFDLNTNNSDVLSLSGNYTHTGGNILVNVLNLPNLGTPYNLINYSGTQSGTPTVTFQGLAGTRIVGAVDYGTGSASTVSVTFNGAAANLVWTGLTDNTWDVGGTGNNWLNGATADNYLNYDNVLFNDAPTSGNLNPVLNATITPGSVTFDNSTKNYTLSGTGGFSGTTIFTKSGTGSLTLTTTNTHTGGTNVLGGKLTVGNGGTTGSLGSSLIYNDSTLAYNRSDTVTLTNTIDGNGTLEQAGTGTLVLNSAQSLLGYLKASTGTVQIGTGASNTPSAPVSSGQGITVESGATLSLPRLHGLTTQNIVWNLPAITLNGGSKLMFQAQLGGNIHQLNAPIGVSGAVTIDNNGGGYSQDLQLTGQITGTGTINYLATTASGSSTTTRTLTASNGNTTYSGNWFLNYTATTTDDFVALQSTATGALGSGVVTLSNRAQLFGTADGTLDSLTGITLQQTTSSAFLASGWINPAATLTVSNGTVTVGAASSFKTVAINHLVQSGGVIELDLDQDENTGDKLILEGDLNATAGQIKLTSSFSPAGKTYDVVTYGGSLIAAPTVTGDFGRLVQTVNNGTGTNDKVTVSFTGNAANIVWKGNNGTSPNNWDNNTTINWVLSGNPEKFLTYDHVLFDDTASSFTPSVIGALNVGSTTFNNSSNAYVVSGTGSIGGVGGLTKNGTGSVTLSTANTFTGGVTVNAGKLILGNAAAMGPSTGGAKVVTVQSGGQLDFNNQSPTARTYTFKIAGTGDGTGVLVNSTGTGITSNAGLLNLELLDHATVGGAQRFDIGYANGGSGTITGNGKTLTKVGANDIAIRGDASGSPIQIVVSAGRLWAENTDFAFGGTTGSVTVNNGATLGTYGTRSISTPVTLNAGATLQNIGGTTPTGSWNGTLALAGDANINPGAAGQTITLGGVISGSGVLNVSPNGGTLNINAVNTFTGGMIVGSAATTATTVNLGSSSQVDVISSKTIRVGNNAASGTNIQTLNASGVVNNAGTLYVGRPGVVNIQSGAVWNQSGAASLNAQGGYAADLNVLSGGTFNYTGSSTFKIEPAAANSGVSTLDISGTFSTTQGFARTVTPSTGTSTVTLLGGTLKLADHVAAITSTDVLFVLGAGGGTIDTNHFNGTIATAISGTTTLTKKGTGTLTLDGNNTYSGGTSVEGGTIGGKGAAASVFSVSSGASIAPGTGIGTFATAGLTLTSGSTLAVQINSTTAAADKLTSSGVVNLGGATVSFSEIGSGIITAGTKLVILDYTGNTLSGTFNGYAEGASVSVGANTFTLSYADSSRVTLTSTTSASPYDSWASSSGLDGSPGKEAGFDVDPDKDGVANGLEWILGGNPLAQDAASLLQTSTNGSGDLILSFKREEDSIGQATLTVEIDTDLAGTWTTFATIGATGSGNVSINTAPDPDQVTVTIPGTNAVGGKLFARLRGVKP